MSNTPVSDADKATQAYDAWRRLNARQRESLKRIMEDASQLLSIRPRSAKEQRKLDGYNRQLRAIAKGMGESVAHYMREWVRDAAADVITARAERAGDIR